jgi:hypothetical protein
MKTFFKHLIPVLLRNGWSQEKVNDWMKGVEEEMERGTPQVSWKWVAAFGIKQ